MDVEPQDVETVVGLVWEATLGLQIAREAGEPVDPTGSWLLVTQGVGGAWHGRVVLGLSSELAARAAEAMFGLARDDLTSDQVRDAVGELANMTAGNLKALLPQPAELTLPEPATEPFSALLARGRVLLELLFRCEGEPVVVAVVEEGVRDGCTGRSSPRPSG